MSAGEAPEGASPPCYAEEADPAYMGLAGDAAENVQRWRKAERKRLIAARLALPSQERRERNGRILRHMLHHLRDEAGPLRDRIVSFYWPFKGEPDLRPLMDEVIRDGGQPALPVVIALGQPLVFRAWRPGEPLGRGIWNIPIPSEEARQVVPDIVIAPVIGFDPGCYRLGFGGGFYDRTLASLPARPRTVGVGFSAAAIATIYPQWHDIALDAVITEDGTACRRPCA